jgi:hypothetical protein
MRFLSFPALVVLAGCAPVASLLGSGAEPVVVSQAGPDQMRPVARPETGGAPVVAPAGSPRRLGNTVAALGDPSRPGAWMETPLVSVEQPGQVRHGELGLAVTLIPAGGQATGGSRLSLAAMQELKLPLTELAEVEVFVGG